MNVEEAQKSRTNYHDLIGKTVRYQDRDYLVHEIVVVPIDSSSNAEFANGYVEEGFDSAVQRMPKGANVEVALLGLEVISGTTAVLKVTEVEFLL